MAIAFDQYQRYKNAQLVINTLREQGQTFRILEVGANAHKNLEKFLPQDEIYYLDIQLPENLQNDPQYFLGDATDMDFADNAFDIVVALDVYEHILPEKREMFLSELHRVGKYFFVICAPFYNEEVIAAEMRSNLIYKAIYGEDYIWLKEHQENGLPDFNSMKNFLKKQVVEFISFPHGDLGTWEKLMNAHFLSLRDGSLIYYCDALDEYYNEHIFEQDYVEPAYRNFVVGFKMQCKKNMEFSFNKNDSSASLAMLDTLLGNFNLLFENKNSAISEMKQDAIQKQLQVFYDYGEGFSEEESFKIDYRDSMFSISLEIPDTVQQIRIDPIEGHLCMIKDLVIQNEYGQIEPQLNSGEFLDEVYVFHSKDPQIVINRSDRNFEKLLVQGTIWIIESAEMQTFVSLLQKNNLQTSQLQQREIAYKNRIKEIVENYAALMQKSESQMIEHEKVKEELEKQLEKVENELNHYQTHYHAAINQREDLKRQLQQAQMNYEIIANSTCWQLTAPLRKVLDVTKQSLKSNRYTYLFCKGLKCWKKNGFSYTWKKVHNWKQHRLNSQNALQPLYTEAELEEQKKVEFSKDIKFSIIVPLYNTPEKFLHEMIQSVIDQTYANWELCMADGSDNDHTEVEKICRNYAQKDSRIKYKKLEKNLGISGNSNACIEMATGEYIGLLDHDDLLAPNALFENAIALEKVQADVLYSDEDHISKEKRHVNPFYKPDWSPDLLYSQMYICHFLVIKKDVLESVGGFRSEYNGSQDYDLMLRLSEQTNQICHIPLILYTWRESEESTAANADAKPYAHTAGKKALEDHIKRTYGKDSHVEDGKYMFTYDARFPMGETHMVSIIIPMKDKWEMTSECIHSILEKSSYQNYEIIILNNRSEEKETLNWLNEIILLDNRIKVFEADMEFNWSRLNNFGMEKALGDVYIFLNNDTLVISPDWIERLVENAVRENIGVVGAMLLYEDKTIQHAGVVVGIGGWADHIFKGTAPIHYCSPFVSPVLSRNVLAVTGACMAISRDTIEAIGKFDEGFVICGSDVEMCIRAYENGLYNRYDANVCLYHLESKSRDSYIPEVDFEKSYKCYTPYRENVDPFFNINLDNVSLTPKERRISMDLVNFKNFIKRNRCLAPAYKALKNAVSGASDYNIPEIEPIYARKGAKANTTYRLNLLIPSVDEKHVFGGIATALKFFEELRVNSGYDARIITLDAPIEEKTSMAPKDYKLTMHSEDSNAKLQVISFSDRYGKNIPVCENDLFMATGWWTAYNIKNVIAWQNKMYEKEKSNPLIYFIQDFEPGFYPWSSRYLLADSTYRLNIPTIAIFNSLLLKDFFEKKNYVFSESWSFNPSLNENLKKILIAAPKENKRRKQILIYGRPSTERNAFSLIVIALKLWKTKQNHVRDWVIYSAGEEHPDIDLGDGVIIHSVGKLSLEKYANLMLDSYIGISLMASPHPSYPPLEMATFGVRTITNNFENKNLNNFNKNIISLASITPEEIANTLWNICDNYNGKGEIQMEEDYIMNKNPFDNIVKELLEVLK